MNEDTDLVTISIGGNDAKFVYTVTRCIMNGFLNPGSNCFNQTYSGTQTFGEVLRAWIKGSVTEKLVQVYEEIKAKSNENAAVVVLGYPLLVSGNSNCINPSGAPFISYAERIDLREIGKLLHQQIISATKRAGVHYVPVIDKFEGHNVCDGDPWIQNALARPDSHKFHPTSIGQDAHARALNEFFESTRLSYTLGFFASGMPRNPVPVP